MAVTNPTPPILKSAPDMSRLNTFAGHVVTVTKHPAARGTAGEGVLTTMRMPLSDILALQMSLPLRHGAGYYLFDVTEDGGVGKDQWMVKLGGDRSEFSQQEGNPMVGQAPPPGAPLDGDVKQIMPGFFHNEALGLLHTRWGETVPWRTGDPWPKAPTNASHLAAVPANATPWNWPPQQQPGWGGYSTGGSSEVDVLKAELQEQKRAREMDELRAEQRRRDDEMQKRMDQQAANFEKLITTLTSKPSGPSETEQRALREAEEVKRRLEQNERDARQREEARAAEERHREEMRLMREQITAVTANKADPMMPLITQMLSSQASSAAENIRLMRDAAAATASVAERNAITLPQMMEIVRSAREGGNESSKIVVDSMKDAMSVQKEVFSALLDVAGQGSQPWYANAIQEGIGKMGAVAQALMERNQREAAAATQPRQPVQQMRMPPAARPAQVPVAGTIQPTARPAPIGPVIPGRAVDTGGRPEGTMFDDKTAEFVLADGRRVKQDFVAKEGWGKVLSMPPFAPGAPAVPAGQPPAAAPPVQLVPPAPTAAPAPAATVRGKKKPPQPRARAAAPPPPPPPAAEEPDEVLGPLPPPANGVNYTLDEMRGLAPEHMYEVASLFPDEQFFGATMSEVVKLRIGVQNGLAPAQVAEAVLGARAYLQGFSQLPPAFEILAAEHVEVLVSRLLPGVPEEYQDAVVDAIEATLEAESGGGAQ
jgi:hypothetical protein